MKTIKVNAIKCNDCGDIIYSRARHDFRWCSCGEVAVDGGFDYMKICYKKTSPVIFELTVPSTKDELYNDWNYRREKFGIIKNLTK